MEDDDPLDFLRDDPKLPPEVSLAQSRSTLDRIAQEVAESSPEGRLNVGSEQQTVQGADQGPSTGTFQAEDLKYLAKVWRCLLNFLYEQQNPREV